MPTDSVTFSSFLSLSPADSLFAVHRSYSLKSLYGMSSFPLFISSGRIESTVIMIMIRFQNYHCVCVVVTSCVVCTVVWCSKLSSQACKPSQEQLGECSVLRGGFTVKLHGPCKAREGTGTIAIRATQCRHLTAVQITFCN